MEQNLSAMYSLMESLSRELCYNISTLIGDFVSEHEMQSVILESQVFFSWMLCRCSPSNAAKLKIIVDSEFAQECRNNSVEVPDDNVMNFMLEIRSAQYDAAIARKMTDVVIVPVFFAAVRTVFPSRLTHHERTGEILQKICITMLQEMGNLNFTFPTPINPQIPFEMYLRELISSAKIFDEMIQ